MAQVKQILDAAMDQATTAEWFNGTLFVEASPWQMSCLEKILEQLAGKNLLITQLELNHYAVDFT